MLVSSRNPLDRLKLWVGGGFQEGQGSLGTCSVPRPTAAGCRAPVVSSGPAAPGERLTGHTRPRAAPCLTQPRWEGPNCTPGLLSRSPPVCWHPEVVRAQPCDSMEDPTRVTAVRRGHPQKDMGCCWESRPWSVCLGEQEGQAGSGV